MDETLKARLVELGLTDEQIEKLVAEGANNAEDLARLSAEEIRSLTDCGLITAKKVAAEFATTPDAGTALSAFASMNNVLPVVPADENWLQSLKVGGILKFNVETVTGTVSAALASRVGLYDLPKLIVEAMERHADTLEESVPPEFFEVQRSLTERSYAEIFAAIPGATGRYATDARRNELLKRLRDNLWPSLMSFQTLLSTWFDTWQKTSSSPGMLLNAFTALVGGSGVLPPSMMQPPPTDSLRDAADNVINSINRIFAGTGKVTAMALAYDAQQIRKALENPSLPAHIGASNREQMLRMLNVAVSSDYPRLEQNLKQYVLGVVELPNVTAGQTELTYVSALFQLGGQIPWDRLGEGPATSGALRPTLGRDPLRVSGDR